MRMMKDMTSLIMSALVYRDEDVEDGEDDEDRDDSNDIEDSQEDG